MGQLRYFGWGSATISLGEALFCPAAGPPGRLCHHPFVNQRKFCRAGCRDAFEIVCNEADNSCHINRKPSRRQLEGGPQLRAGGGKNSQPSAGRLNPPGPCGQRLSVTSGAQAKESLSECRMTLSRVCLAKKGEFRQKTAKHHRRPTCRKMVLAGKTWSPDRESNSGPTHEY